VPCEVSIPAAVRISTDAEQSENFTPAAEDFAEEFDISWDTSVHGFDGPVQSSYPVFQWQSISMSWSETAMIQETI